MKNVKTTADVSMQSNVKGVQPVLIEEAGELIDIAPLSILISSEEYLSAYGHGPYWNPRRSPSPYCALSRVATLDSGAPHLLTISRIDISSSTIRDIYTPILCGCHAYSLA